jgi:hypothetical protein
MENKTYIWTSQTFTGSVTFTFNADGILLQYDITQAAISHQQLQWFTNRLPRSYNELVQVLKKAKQSKLQLQPNQPITFDLAWNTYNEKVRSSKKKSLKIWNKLKTNDQVRSYLFIDAYKRSVPDGVAYKYFETYLNAELWNN